MEGLKPQHFVPIRESTGRNGLDVNGKDDIVVSSIDRGHDTLQPVGSRFDLGSLFMKKARKEKETIVQPLETRLAFGDATLPQNHALLAGYESLGNKLPFFECDGAPVRIVSDHLFSRDDPVKLPNLQEASFSVGKGGRMLYFPPFARSSLRLAGDEMVAVAQW